MTDDLTGHVFVDMHPCIKCGWPIYSDEPHRVTAKDEWRHLPGDCLLGDDEVSRIGKAMADGGLI